MSRALLALAGVLVAGVVAVAVVLSRPPAPPLLPGPDPDPAPTRAPEQSTAPGHTLAPCPVREPAKLSVVTLNIHAGRTRAGRLDLPEVARELRAWGADVVLLQEVDRGRERTDFVDQAQWLGEQLGMRAEFAPVRRLQPGTTGNAVLSALPVLGSARHSLPRLPGLMRRGLLRVAVDLAGHRVDMLTTHLDHASPTARRAQARAVARLAGRSGGPTVLGGDLNAVPGMPPLRALARAGLVDAWPVAGLGEGLTVPGAAPRRRIDYVLSSSHFVATDAEVLPSLVSDHRAVRAELMLVPEPCR